MTAEILCDGCGRASALAARNCPACGRLLDKRMWRFAAKVEKDYHDLGLARTRAVVVQAERLLRVEMPDASDEAVGANAERIRAVFARIYGFPRARMAGFEGFLLTNGRRSETIAVPRPWFMQSDRGAIAGVLVLVCIALAPLVWCILALTR